MTCRDALLVLALSLAAAPARADDAELDRRLEARAARLAEHHYRAGAYYRAISSYEELSLFATDDATRTASAIRIAMSYHHGRQLADAVARYDRALALARDPDLVQALRIQRALARAERTLDEPGAEALDAIAAELAPSTAGGAHRRLALFSLARIRALDGRADEAARLAQAVGGPLDRVLARALERPRPSTRSPWLGLALSAVVPGAGSVYGGHLVDGLYYFGLTTLSGLGAWEVHDGGRAWTDQKVTFYGLAALGAAFYAAGVLQGYVSVARRNAVRELGHRRALWRATDRPLPLEDLPVVPAATEGAR